MKIKEKVNTDLKITYEELMSGLIVSLSRLITINKLIFIKTLKSEKAIVNKL